MEAGCLGSKLKIIISTHFIAGHSNYRNFFPVQDQLEYSNTIK